MVSATSTDLSTNVRILSPWASCYSIACICTRSGAPDPKGRLEYSGPMENRLPLTFPRPTPDVGGRWGHAVWIRRSESPQPCSRPWPRFADRSVIRQFQWQARKLVSFYRIKKGICHSCRVSLRRAVAERLLSGGRSFGTPLLRCMHSPSRLQDLPFRMSQALELSSQL